LIEDGTVMYNKMYLYNRYGKLHSFSGTWDHKIKMDRQNYLLPAEPFAYGNQLSVTKLILGVMSVTGKHQCYYRRPSTLYVVVDELRYVRVNIKSIIILGLHTDRIF
jgi:hypothetical protein